MKRTMITTKSKTTLTIDTTEDLYLERMGAADPRIPLIPGVNKIPVSAGVFWVLSKSSLSVTADSPDVQITITTTGDKDGMIDPLDGKGQPAPQ